MDNLGDILGKKSFRPPDEIQIIKDYVQEHYQSPVTVEVKPNQLVITVANSSLAGALRLKLHELAELCRTDKRLVIRIG